MSEEDLPNSVSLEFVEHLYEEYLRNPEAAPPDWRSYFQRLSDGGASSRPQPIEPSFQARSIFNPPAAAGNGAGAGQQATAAVLQERIDHLIRQSGDG